MKINEFWKNSNGSNGSNGSNVSVPRRSNLSTLVRTAHLARLARGGLVPAPAVVVEPVPAGPHEDRGAQWLRVQEGHVRRGLAQKRLARGNPRPRNVVRRGRLDVAQTAKWVHLGWKVRSARDRTIRTIQIRVRSAFLESVGNHEKPLHRSSSPQGGKSNKRHALQKGAAELCQNEGDVARIYPKIRKFQHFLEFIFRNSEKFSSKSARNLMNNVEK